MRQPHPIKHHKNKLSSIRIIGGQWRSRKLPVPGVEGLRPTGERIRETLFNWLGDSIYNSRCLDLFAGTGALGLEALSRGAEFCQFVEYHPAAAQQLQENITKLTSEQRCANLSVNDARVYLEKAELAQPFDIVFIDPPFAQNLWKSTIEQLLLGPWLHSNSLLYIEQTRDNIITPDRCRRIKHKSAGQVSFSLYRLDHDLHS